MTAISATQAETHRQRERMGQLTNGRETHINHRMDYVVGRGWQQLKQRTMQGDTCIINVPINRDSCRRRESLNLSPPPTPFRESELAINVHE